MCVHCIYMYMYMYIEHLEQCLDIKSCLHEIHCTTRVHVQCTCVHVLCTNMHYYMYMYMYMCTSYLCRFANEKC